MYGNLTLWKDLKLTQTTKGQMSDVHSVFELCDAEEKVFVHSSIHLKIEPEIRGTGREPQNPKRMLASACNVIHKLVECVISPNAAMKTYQ